MSCIYFSLVTNFVGLIPKNLQAHQNEFQLVQRLQSTN